MLYVPILSDICQAVWSALIHTLEWSWVNYLGPHLQASYQSHLKELPTFVPVAAGRTNVCQGDLLSLLDPPHGAHLHLTTLVVHDVFYNYI